MADTIDGSLTMPTITTTDGTEIFFKDWGDGQPVVFSHGWPLNGDAWAGQMVFMAGNGFRAIAHDRRGHGRSGQPSDGNDMDTYADDLAQVIEHLDLHDAVLVGHSTGGGEVTRYMGRHGTGRVAKAVLLSAIPPLMLKTEANPEGLPIEVFDGLRTDLLRGPSEFYRQLAEPFYGANRPGSEVSQGQKDDFWRMSMMAGLKGAYECIEQFSEIDFTQDLRQIEVPVLVAHGDDDQIVPFHDAAPKTAELLEDAELKVYPGQPHGLTGAHEQEFNADLLAFARA
ncbi:alpha/beta fold hydrolase [Geodermatophilus sabuli]|uniref:Non-heme chloroperoxidase n=2 Tax=Geodermatophilus sabuli TaxID=1564158 RepID=A0A285E7Y0_9ACTN|nr:alpha/beta hydrolase [Geodermatophilus sabuli]SNX94216.1 non-heme chloroperoxidase [Geodermatophilus sabuli]